MKAVQKVATLCGFSKPYEGEFRHIYINHQQLRKSEPVPPYQFPSNRVITSRYNIITFLPKNLFEQFSRVANFYFLIVAIVQLVIDTPVSPTTSIAPLVFVLSVTACKQAYEDFLRHRADNKVNNSPVSVLRGSKVDTAKSFEIKVGDIIKVHKNESFPCDLLLLSSSDPNGECSITTANLDGETNLKTVFSVMETKHLNSTIALNKKLRAKITCEHPNTDLYRFSGNLTIKKDNRDELTVPLTAKNTLLRGAVLRDTDFVYGCAVYTGPETKMQLNSQKGRTKKSVVEKRLDRYLLFFMLFLFLESIFCTVMKWVYALYDKGIKDGWYIPPEVATGWRVTQDLLGFIVLFNYLIPISLYVTIEMQKFFGSMFFEFDLEMYYEDPESGEKFTARANTSDLNEELGQIQYLFSDKTGTLTENKMTFRKCSINGKKLVDFDGVLWQLEDDRPVKKRVRLEPDEELFFLVLALCHTVRVEHKAELAFKRKTTTNKQYTADAAKHYVYQASSPDEKAFVEACRNYEITFHGTENDVSVVTIKNSPRKYKICHILEFDSDRKCMSVIVQREDNSYWLLTKGAETSMLGKCISGDKDTIIEHSGDFAYEGLRVLVIGHKQLSETDYRRIDADLTKAYNDVGNRDELLVSAFANTETELEALGATAVEDELQTGVKETITDLRTAGIQVWILTGDKRETAENISLSAGHFTDEMARIRIVEKDSAKDCLTDIDRGLEEISQPVGSQCNFCVVVDGQSLQYLVSDHEKELKDKFLKLCGATSAVLCCRCTPLQKSKVVAMVKNGIQPKPVTCAIGDGANDVSMIREAHVGIGLYGKEGRAAALNSDYSFARFQFIRKALLFHGHLYYVRLSTLVQYFFYKNVAFITSELFYAFYSGFSAQSLFDPIFLTIYNLTMTSLPILLFGIFEQHVDRQRLYQEPALYKENACNRRLWWRQLLIWSMLGLWHCLVAFFGVTMIYQINNDIGYSGMPVGGVFEYGTLIIQCVLAVVTLKLLTRTYYLTVLTLIGLLITVLGFIMIMCIYSAFLLSVLSNNYYFYHLYFVQMAQPSTWVIMLCIVILCLLPDLILKAVNDSRIALEAKRNEGIRDIIVTEGDETSLSLKNRSGTCSSHLTNGDVTITHNKGYANTAFEPC